ncbi:MAG: hypothetical protein HY067_05090 [Betaproteobacteria bacterium]|nr:hypothetical protein [Betaproteobacteria bacterium]
MPLRATLLILLCGANTAAADDNPDLLFNCNLAGLKRAMTLEGARNILWDSGNAYAATVSAQSIDAVYLHKWSSDSTMRHHVVIGRLDGKLSMEVDELGADGEVLNEMVRETGICSPEKIHPRHFKDVDPKRLRH